MHSLIIYGGTFDPVHNGHIETARQVQNHFHFERFMFLPCKIPLLKNQAVATPTQRIKMLELALAPYPGNFEINLSEINRDTPSYTVDSLQAFRTQLGPEIAITLLMGADAFNELPRWHRWLKLLTLANILVIDRAGFNEPMSAAPLLKVLIQKHETFDGSALTKQAQGLVYRYDAGHFNISASLIRAQLYEGKSLQGYLPAAVLSYIKQNNLYFREKT